MLLLIPVAIDLIALFIEASKFFCEAYEAASVLNTSSELS